MCGMHDSLLLLLIKLLCPMTFFNEYRCIHTLKYEKRAGLAVEMKGYCGMHPSFSCRMKTWCTKRFHRDPDPRQEEEGILRNKRTICTARGMLKKQVMIRVRSWVVSTLWHNTAGRASRQKREPEATQLVRKTHCWWKEAMKRLNDLDLELLSSEGNRPDPDPQMPCRSRGEISQGT